MTDPKPISRDEIEAELYELECRISSSGLSGEVVPIATLSLVRAARYLVSRAGEAPRGLVLVPPPGSRPKTETWYACNLYAATGFCLSKGIGRTAELARQDASRLFADGAYDRYLDDVLTAPPDRAERTRHLAIMFHGGKELACGYGRSDAQALHNAKTQAQVFTGQRVDFSTVHVSWKKVLL